MLENILLPAGSGVIAGLGVAMPLGAIAALLLREGIVNGFWVAASAAAGVALVDTTYCAVAMMTGAAFAPVVQSNRSVFLTLSGLLIVAMGVRQLMSGSKRRSVDADDAGSASPGSAFVRFVGLTAINPLTLVYFGALAGVVTTHNSSWLGPVIFVVAVGLSSLAWQVLIAPVGSVFGGTLSAAAVKRIGFLASILIIGLGGAIVLTS